MAEALGKMKFSLDQQIDEVKRELAQRAEVYPRLVGQHKMRESIATFRTDRLKAVLRTLEWLRLHEVKIKSFLGAEGERDE